ncbi:tyrosine-type recombinase/integrase [Saccharicrinis sp. GN24d3]|uniref:tyrosine-type recombinase/integrase n=1 Tax=Saccharicrinis sp. GN24d3 TaxID=3458416 RepID=UPI0040351FD6
MAKDAGIDVKQTSYVSRHSFASITINKAVTVTPISEMLGHQSLSTTHIYLATLQKDIIDGITKIKSINALVRLEISTYPILE